MVHVSTSATTGIVTHVGTPRRRATRPQPWPTTTTISRLSKNAHPANTRAKPAATARENTASAIEASTSDANGLAATSGGGAGAAGASMVAGGGTPAPST